MIRLLCVLILAWHVPTGSSDVSQFNVPDAVDSCLKPFASRYKFSGRINPFYLRGDFDADGRADYAVLVTDVRKAERGMVVCLSSTKSATIIGAGVRFNKLTDLSFEAWMVYPKGPVERGVGEGAPPTLRGDAISIVWPERASALVYWDGKEFRWYQQGD
ncbi:MAG TPA: hypothetical protein VE398_17600 [Acidobacteriota bacterium]|nr:hypothetical protein [Acidobacteriota bacterium]